MDKTRRGRKSISMETRMRLTLTSVIRRAIDCSLIRGGGAFVQHGTGGKRIHRSGGEC